jgi:hypothetical protein
VYIVTRERPNGTICHSWVTADSAEEAAQKVQRVCKDTKRIISSFPAQWVQVG